MASNAVEAPSRQVLRAMAREAAKRGVGARTVSMTGQVVSTSQPHEAPGKGLFDGNCNRTACQEPIAGDNWFNTSTRAYYCRRCASLINKDALRFDGVRICVSVEGPEERPAFPSDEMQRFREERKRAQVR